MGEGLLAICRREIRRIWVIAFTAAFFTGMIVHMYKFTNTLRNHDSLFNFYSDQNILGSGRWFLSIACQFSSYFDLPWLIGVISVLLIALTAVLIVGIFDIENPVMAILTGGLLATFPAVTQTFYFEFTADGYMLAMVLAALAVRLSMMEENRIRYLLAAAICICLCCATYQAYVSFALVLALCYFALELLEDRHTIGEIFRWIRNQALIYLGGLGTYFIVWQILMKIFGYSATTYEGISTIGQMNIHNINGAIYSSVYSFILWFVEWNFFRYGFTAFSVLNILFLICAAAIGIAAFKKSRIYRSKLKTLLLAASVLAIPFAVFMWYFASYGVRYVTRMEQSICILYIFSGVLYCRWAKIRFANVMALLLGIIMLNNSVNANIFYYKMNQCGERTYATAVEMATRIHLLDDGTVKKVAFFGYLKNSGFDADDYYEPDGLRQLGGLKSMNRNLMSGEMYIALYLSNVLDFQLSYYLDHPEAEIPAYKKGKEDPVSEKWKLEFPLCDSETRAALEKSEAVRDMDLWPAADSVKVIGDTVVVKMSETKKGD